MLATEDEQLSLTVLLSIGQQVMLTTNLWVEAGLVNGALAQVIAILYNTTTTPPNLPFLLLLILCITRAHHGIMPTQTMCESYL